MTVTESKDIKTRVLESLLKSGVTSFILALLLFWFVGTVKDMITVEVPKHLAIIQAGYDKINTQNNEANRARDVRYAETLKLLSERFDINIEKIDAKLDRLIQQQMK